MPIDKEKKLINRMNRLGKYITVLLKADFPMPLKDFVLSAIEGGKHLEWIEKKIMKLTRDFTIHRGHKGSNRYFSKYYEFITKMIIAYGEKFKKTLRKMIGLVLGMRTYNKTMKKLGNPVAGQVGFGMAPFDMVSDSLRGMRGAMIDMYRNPEELKRTCDIFVDHILGSMDMFDALLGKPDENTIPLSFIPLHRGANGFMSNEQFEEFYWPSLTAVMEGMIKNDIIPLPFFEGRYSDRLEFLAEFAKKHKGKLVYWFHDTDLIKVKEMMGDYVCIRGNVPASLLIGGPPSAVEEYVKKMIDGCKDGGGYLVDGGVSGIPNEARHENVQAMTDAVHKYGVYRK